LAVTLLAEIFPAFAEPEVPLPSSQKATFAPNADPTESTLFYYSLFIYDPI
jgi:hypothetical protein